MQQENQLEDKGRERASVGHFDYMHVKNSSLHAVKFGSTHRSIESSLDGRRIAYEVAKETQLLMAVRLNQQSDMMVDCASERMASLISSQRKLIEVIKYLYRILWAYDVGPSSKPFLRRTRYTMSGQKRDLREPVGKLTQAKSDLQNCVRNSVRY